MLASPRIPEITQRDRFIRRAAAQRSVFAVVGEDGLARVPSQRHHGREVTLLWTSRATAERWADVIAQRPRIKQLMLDAVLADVLPALARLNRLVGVDWGSDAIEPEIAPADLARRLVGEVAAGFVERVVQTRTVFTLEDGAGPALLVSAGAADRLVLPCWSERAFAEVRIEGPWADMMTVEVPIEVFATAKLGWLEGRGWLVAPDHLVGSPVPEVAPADLRRRLKL